MSRTLPWVALFVAGCAMDEVGTAEPTSTRDQAVISPNGNSANGVPLGVISPNGPSATQTRLAGVGPVGLSADGVAIRIAALADAGGSAPWAGAELVGSTWTGYVSDGTTIALRIDDAAPSAGDSARWSYGVSASLDGTWRPLCPEAAGAPGRAVSVHGSWNLAEGVSGGGAYRAAAAELTIACRGSAIAKCVELGYAPATGHAGALAGCVRALRGDFCGDGRSYTVDGTLVNLYDRDGVQADNAAWTAEAEWTDRGARCISKKKATRFSQSAQLKPSCYPDALKPTATCGSEFSGDTTIITELAPQ